MCLIILEYQILGEELEVLNPLERGDQVGHLVEALVEAIKLL